MKLSNEAVDSLFIRCLFADPATEGAQAPDNAVKVEGIMHSYAFDPDKLAEHADAIAALLHELPTEFHVSGGGGWSFLNACVDRHGEQWTGLHLQMEKLCCLGIAAGHASWVLPRSMWPALPGGMPYLQVGTRAPAPSIV